MFISPVFKIKLLILNLNKIYSFLNYLYYIYKMSSINNFPPNNFPPNNSSPNKLAIIIPVVIVIAVVVIILIQMNIIKFGEEPKKEPGKEPGKEQSVNCVGEYTTWSDCGPIKNEESTKFRTYKIKTLPEKGGTNCNIDNNKIETIKCELNVYPPIKAPSAIFGGSTDISVEYDNDADNRYQIKTSFTYEARGRIQHLVDNNNSTSWTSLYNIYFQPPNYAGTNHLSENTKDIKGEWISYKLPKQINLYKYTISSNNNSPRTWIVYGSNNGTIWTEISDASQKEILSQYDSSNTYTKILKNKSELYQYFGIVITSINGGPGDFAAYVSDIRFYGI